MRLTHKLMIYNLGQRVRCFYVQDTKAKNLHLQVISAATQIRFKCPRFRRNAPGPKINLIVNKKEMNKNITTM